jgi:hypothetical protein
MDFQLSGHNRTNHTVYARAAFARALTLALPALIFEGTSPGHKVGGFPFPQPHEGPNGELTEVTLLGTRAVFEGYGGKLNEENALLQITTTLSTEDGSEGYTYFEDDFDPETTEWMKPSEMCGKINTIAFAPDSEQAKARYIDLVKNFAEVLSVISDFMSFFSDDNFEVCVEGGDLDTTLAEGETAIYIRLKNSDDNNDLPDELVRCFWVSLILRSPETYNF